MSTIDKMDNLINTETRHEILRSKDAINSEFRKAQKLVMRLAAYMRPEHIKDEFLPAANSIIKLQGLIWHNNDLLHEALFDNDDQLYHWEEVHNDYKEDQED